MNLPCPTVNPLSGIVALNLPDGLSKRLRPHADPFVYSNGLHITLAYLGNLDRSRLKRAVRELSFLKDELEPFKMSVQGPGLFTGKKDIKLLLVNGSGLSTWAYKVRKTLYDAGVMEKQEYGFLPHITLSYHEKDLNPFWHEQISISYQWDCSDFSLYRGSQVRFKFKV